MFPLFNFKQSTEKILKKAELAVTLFFYFSFSYLHKQVYLLSQQQQLAEKLVKKARFHL